MKHLIFGKCAAILATGALLAVLWQTRPQPKPDLKDLAQYGIAHALDEASR